MQFQLKVENIRYQLKVYPPSPPLPLCNATTTQRYFLDNELTCIYQRCFGGEGELSLAEISIFVPTILDRIVDVCYWACMSALQMPQNLLENIFLKTKKINSFKKDFLVSSARKFDLN